MRTPVGSSNIVARSRSHNSPGCEPNAVIFTFCACASAHPSAQSSIADMHVHRVQPIFLLRCVWIPTAAAAECGVSARNAGHGKAANHDETMAREKQRSARHQPLRLPVDLFRRAVFAHVIFVPEQKIRSDHAVIEAV